MRIRPGRVGIVASISFSVTLLTLSASAATIKTGVAPVVTLSGQADFPPTLVGLLAPAQTLTISNNGSSAVTVRTLTLHGGAILDYFGSSSCYTLSGSTPIPAGKTCTVSTSFLPGALGSRTTTLTVAFVESGLPHLTIVLSGTGVEGYYAPGRAGEVGHWGAAPDFGDASHAQLRAPIVGFAPDRGAGYWLVGSDGGVFAFGDAGFFGSTGAVTLNRPIVGMASTPTGRGYWLVASDGGVFAFGDAAFFGSTGAVRLNRPIVGMAATPTGRGYWLVASDGGVFTFGDAGFFGSTGAVALNQPIVGLAGTPTGDGYWLVASDGGIFTFGDAGFFGSTGAVALDQPVVGMAAAPTGTGYWLVASDGGVFTFGAAPFAGSFGGQGVGDIVGIASASPQIPAYLVDAPSAASRSVVVATVNGSERARLVG